MTHTKFIIIFFLLLTKAIGQTKKESIIKKEIYQLHKKTEIVSDSVSKLITECNNQIKISTRDTLLVSKLKIKLDSLWNLFDENLKTEVKNDLEFAMLNPNSLLALKLIRSRLTRQEGMSFYETYKLVFNNFSVRIKESEEGREMCEKLKKFKQSKIGTKAPEFIAKDINGITLSLKDYIGKKYILMDFWASWCGPCIEEFPFIKELYKKYSHKGFEIISITKDENLENWKKTILNEKIDAWKQISILENNNSIEKDFFVFGIPHKILIDKNGVIIGKWKGSGEKNQAELKNLLKEKIEAANY